MNKSSQPNEALVTETDNTLQTRREFVAKSLKGVTVACACATLPALTACGGDDNPAGGSDPVTITLDLTESRYAALQNVGGTVALARGDVSGLPSNGVFLIRSSDTQVRVLDRTCTHQACQVMAFVGTTATCDCHGSQFNTSGAVTQGPAARSLTSYSSTLTGNTLEFTV